MKHHLAVFPLAYSTHGFPWAQGQRQLAAVALVRAGRVGRGGNVGRSTAGDVGGAGKANWSILDKSIRYNFIFIIIILQTGKDALILSFRMPVWTGSAARPGPTGRLPVFGVQDVSRPLGWSPSSQQA
jgi:hypothetical protein